MLLNSGLVSSRRLAHDLDDFRILPDFVEVNVHVVRIVAHGDVAVGIQIATEDAECLSGRC